MLCFRTCVLTEPTEINLTLDSSGITKELSEWGAVSGDAEGFQCCMMEDFEEDLNLSLR